MKNYKNRFFQFLIAAISLILIAEQSVFAAAKDSLTIKFSHVIEETPQEVTISFIVSYDGSFGQLCYGTLAKSETGYFRSMSYPPGFLGFQTGDHIEITEVVNRPPGNESMKTDHLQVMFYRCGGLPVSSVSINFPHQWPEIKTKAADKDPSVDRYSPWQLLYMNSKEADFFANDAALDEWEKSKAKDDDGMPAMSGFRQFYLYDPDNNRDWKGELFIYNTYLRINPKSRAGALTLAGYWVANAWHIRTTSCGCNIENFITLQNSEEDPFALKLFHKRLKTAESILIKSKKYAATTPIWYEIYLDIAVAQHRNRKFVENLFNEGIKKFPDYEPLYFAMAKFWDNVDYEKADWTKIDDLAKRIVAATSATEGTANYARLYEQIDFYHNLELDTFNDTPLNWPTMRKSFEDLIQRYPSQMNLNHFAYYSCRVGDKQAYQNVRAKIGTNISSGWPSNYSIDLCDSRFELKS